MPRGEDIVSLARKSLGVRYVWGGTDLRNGMDCSGLVQSVYKAYGISLPRVTYDQINVGYNVSPNKLRPGDLVFFDTDRSRRGPDHVGIYIGGGKFIHAPRPGQGVKISSLSDSYYMDRWMAGRRIPGVNADPSSGGGYAEEVAPRLDAHELAETYGMSYAFFKSQPSLMKLLNKAVAGQWAPEKFQAEVKNSSWWKKNSESVRKAQILQKTDPATYKASIEAARVSAQQMAVKMGAILPASKLTQLATSMVRLEWNEAQVGSFLGQYVKFQSGTMGGIAGQAAQEIKKQAYNLGVSVTQQSLLNNAQYIVRGLTSMENVQDSLRQQAMGLYPAFAEQIKAGANMTDIATPYAQVLSQELGIPETDISPTTPKIKQALNRVDASGQPSPMSIADFTTMVRNDPKWTQTGDAREKTMTIGRQVLADMGLAG